MNAVRLAMSRTANQRTSSSSIEIGHEHVGGLELVSLRELGGEELRDLLREIDELTIAEEIPLEFAGKALSCAKAARRLSTLVRARRKWELTNERTARVSKSSSRSLSTLTAESKSRICRMAWLIFTKRSLLYHPNFAIIPAAVCSALVTKSQTRRRRLRMVDTDRTPGAHTPMQAKG